MTLVVIPGHAYCLLGLTGRSYMEPWRLRIILPILLVHLLAIPLLVYRFVLHLEEPAWEVQKALGQAQAKLIRDRLAFGQIATAGNPRELQKTIDLIAKSYNLPAISVFNSDGNLRGSHGPSALARIPKKSVSSVEISSDETELHFTEVVRNEAVCYPCHGQTKPILGFITASIPIKDFASKVHSERKHAMLITSGALIFVFSLVFLSHHYFVTAPVNRIMKAMVRVLDGDLSVEIPVYRKDELGTMSESFNQVVRALRKATRELEERHKTEMVRAEQLATVGEIAAGLAHEVKNPLAGISTGLQVIAAETEKNSQFADLLQEMIQETNRIGQTLNRLLAYARPRSTTPQWCDVEKMVTDVRRIFEPQCAKNGVDFVLHITEDTGAILADVQELKQILVNVLRNALEAVSPQGTIEMHVNGSKDEICFCFRDDGVGMDETVLGRIFLPFFTTKPDGTGLGLAIVKRSVEDLGGVIRVESQLGKGTVFQIVLPRGEKL